MYNKFKINNDTLSSDLLPWHSPQAAHATAPPVRVGRVVT